MKFILLLLHQLLSLSSSCFGGHKKASARNHARVNTRCSMSTCAQSGSKSARALVVMAARAKRDQDSHSTKTALLVAAGSAKEQPSFCFSASDVICWAQPIKLLLLLTGRMFSQWSWWCCLCDCVCVCPPDEFKLDDTMKWFALCAIFAQAFKVSAQFQEESRLCV